MHLVHVAFRTVHLAGDVRPVLEAQVPQFKQGLKNTVELMTGKTNLLQAQQNELQSKYLAILNLNMLEFYQTGNIK